MSITTGLWKAYTMAMDEVSARMERICTALAERGVPFALVGGQAVVLWVSTRDPAAVRTTKDVDGLVLACFGVIGALVGIVAPGLPRRLARKLIAGLARIKSVIGTLSQRSKSR